MKTSCYNVVCLPRDNGLYDGCRGVVNWLHDGCIEVVNLVSDGCMEVVNWLYDGCMMIIRHTSFHYVFTTNLSVCYLSTLWQRQTVDIVTLSQRCDDVELFAELCPDVIWWLLWKILSNKNAIINLETLQTHELNTHIANMVYCIIDIIIGGEKIFTNEFSK